MLFEEFCYRRLVCRSRRQTAGHDREVVGEGGIAVELLVRHDEDLVHNNAQHNHQDHATEIENRQRHIIALVWTQCSRRHRDEPKGVPAVFTVGDTSFVEQDVCGKDPSAPGFYSGVLFTLRGRTHQAVVVSVGHGRSGCLSGSGTVLVGVAPSLTAPLSRLRGVPLDAPVNVPRTATGSIIRNVCWSSLSVVDPNALTWLVVEGPTLTPIMPLPTSSPILLFVLHHDGDLKTEEKQQEKNHKAQQEKIQHRPTAELRKIHWRTEEAELRAIVAKLRKIHLSLRLHFLVNASIMHLGVGGQHLVLRLDFAHLQRFTPKLKTLQREVSCICSRETLQCYGHRARRNVLRGQSYDFSRRRFPVPAQMA
mmetsp:Transcript_49362/g.130896  ORF Transcript_49362/g.130896 Transcript_49362/m.130896 type:complete len:366 (-) Transcript_49362:7-1104(-)